MIEPVSFVGLYITISIATTIVLIALFVAAKYFLYELDLLREQLIDDSEEAASRYASTISSIEGCTAAEGTAARAEIQRVGELCAAAIVRLPIARKHKAKKAVTQ